MSRPNEKWNDLRQQFWQIYTEQTTDEITRNIPRCFPPADRPIPVDEIISHMDTYNPHGCYHYGGILPLGQLGQTPAVTVKSSTRWRRFYYADPKPMPSFRKLVKHVGSCDFET